MTPVFHPVLLASLLLLLVVLLSSSSSSFSASAFTASHPRFVTTVVPRNRRVVVLSTTSKPTTEVVITITTTPTTPNNKAPIVINGVNIHITPAIDEHVHKKIGRALSKFSGSVQECDVVLSVSKNPKIKNGHRVEVVTDIKGTTIICKHESPDMYESIDMAAHALTRKLIKYKERRNDGYHGGLAMGEDLRAALDALDDDTSNDETTTSTIDDNKNDDGADAFFYEDAATPYKPTITPVKSFQLDRPISLEEAIFALDYVDHDFYVFRDQTTNEINVVYKRHTGGIGLVAPETSSASS